MFLFPLPPIRPLPYGDGEAYELTEPLRWTDGEVEAGFVTDLATVPRPLRAIAPTSGRHTPAAIRHDRRCDDLNYWHEAWTAAGRPLADSVEYRGETIVRPLVTSVQADREFLDGIRQLDPERPLRALVMWAGVRLGACASAARREGWSEDLLRVIAVVLLVAPLYLPVALVTLLAQAIDGLANRIACRFIRRAVPSTPARPAPLEVAA